VNVCRLCRRRSISTDLQRQNEAYDGHEYEAGDTTNDDSAADNDQGAGFEGQAGDYGYDHDVDAPAGDEFGYSDGADNGGADDGGYNSDY